MNRERNYSGVAVGPMLQHHAHHALRSPEHHHMEEIPNSTTMEEDTREALSPPCEGSHYYRHTSPYSHLTPYNSFQPIGQVPPSVIVANESIYGGQNAFLSPRHHVENPDSQSSPPSTSELGLGVIDYGNQNRPSSVSSSFLLCTICGDRATGKHYGAHSCDGCKGFFRRSVRKNHNYCCRFNRGCIINKHKRNQCRFCRFRKCIRAGMKKEAVQNERDRISHRRTTYTENIPNVITVSLLLKAEHYLRQFSPKSNTINLASMKIAEVDDVCNSMRQQLLALVNWAQYIPAFQELLHEDKITMLRARAGEHLLLGAAWRSIAMDDVLLLGNNCIIPNESSDPEIKRIGRRVMNELVTTFRETNMDENEFVCLKAIVFFDPSIRGLKDISKVKVIRYGIQLILEEYIMDRPLESRGRFGQLLLALQILQSITWQMVEQIQLAELIGSAKIDSLLREMLLGEMPRLDENGDIIETAMIIVESPTSLTGSDVQVSPEPFPQLPESSSVVQRTEFSSAEVLQCIPEKDFAERDVDMVVPEGTNPRSDSLKGNSQAPLSTIQNHQMIPEPSFSSGSNVVRLDVKREDKKNEGVTSIISVKEELSPSSPTSTFTDLS